MVIEPYIDLLGAPMGGEFFDVCQRLDPEIDASHRQVARDCIAKILGEATSAEVFLLALDGLIGDQPAIPVLEDRIRILIRHFVTPSPQAVR